jgi:hypothetical protein
MNLQCHRIVQSHESKCTLKFFLGGGGVDLEAHEESTGVIAGELLGLCDVSAGANNRATQSMDNSGLVVADNRDNKVRGVSLHSSSLG